MLVGGLVNMCINVIHVFALHCLHGTTSLGMDWLHNGLRAALLASSKSGQEGKVLLAVLRLRWSLAAVTGMFTE